MAEESLGIKAGRAALWQIAGGGWQTLVRLGASIYLARALKPSDFGLFGMALLYQGLLVTALSLGFGTGLIVKKELTEDDLSTAFWLSCTARIIIFLAVFLSAPLAAIFWKNPRVEPIYKIFCFVMVKGTANAEEFCEFLRRLMKGIDQKVFLILDNHRIHHSRKVRDLMASTSRELELFYLPPYSPEVNPDEHVWNHVKRNVSRALVVSREHLENRVIGALRSLQKLPSLVHSFFKHLDCCYTLA